MRLISFITDINVVIDGFWGLIYKNAFIPQEDKEVLSSDIDVNNEYKVSRFIVSCMVYLYYSHYVVNKGKDGRLDISFMRLGEIQPPAKFPIYLTEVPSTVDEVIGVLVLSRATTTAD